MTCPKCHGAMRTYERNGIHVEQCADCRGIFLDRGELEHLVAAEAAWQTPAPAPAAAAPPPPMPTHYSQPPKYHKKRKSFFEELFD